MKIFGREPAIIIGFIGSVLAALAGLNLPGLNAGQSSGIVALLTALIIGITTRPVGPAVFTGAFTAFVALLAEYGTNIPDQWVAAITSITLAVFTFIGRGQITPKSDPQPAPTVVI